jgi:hypothetical protein
MSALERSPFTAAELAEFQGEVCGLGKTWNAKVRMALDFAQSHADAIPRIGLVPCGSDAFFVKAATCACFFGLKHNSLNVNFRNHGMARDPKPGNIGRQLLAMGVSPDGPDHFWTKRTLPPFPDPNLNAQRRDPANPFLLSPPESSDASDDDDVLAWFNR